MNTKRLAIFLAITFCTPCVLLAQEKAIKILQPATVKKAKAKPIVLVFEAPGITCKSRFSESLQKNFVKKYDWVKSLKIDYKKSKKDKLTGLHFIGETAVVRLAVEKENQKLKLLRLLVRSRLYAGTENWEVIEKKTVLEILGPKEIVPFMIKGC